MIEQTIARLKNWVWGYNLNDAPGSRVAFISTLRLLLALSRDFSSGQLTMRAMSLVYTTLLSLIPLLAFSFALLKALGLHNIIQPMLERFLSPLGPGSKAITEKLVSFVQEMNVGVLGVAGLVFLLYMVTLLIRKLEADLNSVWEVKHLRKLRSRLSDYLILLLVVPLMLFASVSITAAASSTSLGQTLLGIAQLGSMVYVLGKLLPYVLICGGFVFLYLFVPNTKVRFMPALEGGVLAGILWQSASWIFTSFVAGSGRYNAVYSGFAIVILSLIWLYISWLILLIGGRIAYYLQHPESLTGHDVSPRPGPRMEWKLSLLVEMLVCQQFRRGTTPWQAHALAQQFRVPMELLDPVIATLVDRGLLVIGSDGEILPGRDPASLRIPALMHMLSQEEYMLHPSTTMEPSVEIVRRVTAALNSAVEEAMGEVSISDLLDELEKTESSSTSEQPPCQP